MATVPYVTSGSGLRKFQADGFLFDTVYKNTDIWDATWKFQLQSKATCVARFYWCFCTSSGQIIWSRDSDRLQNWASLILRLSKPSNISCMPSPFPTHDKVKTFRMWHIPCRHHGPNFTSGCKSPLLAKIMIWMLAAHKILLYHYAQLKSTILHTCQLYRYHEKPKRW